MFGRFVLEGGRVGVLLQGVSASRFEVIGN